MGSTEEPVHPLEKTGLDLDAIAAKYAEERTKRSRKDGYEQFVDVKEEFSYFTEDIWAATPLVRDPIHTETKVLIVGAGYAGLVTGVNLRKQGIDDFLIVDKAADFGGTWYWNRYPGVTCDIESVVYLPFLEETGYVPKDRFSGGPEIFEHCLRIAEKWKLRPNAKLQTEITSIKWDGETCRWHTETKHGDHFISQFVVLATGTQHKPKLPGIPGILDFKRDHFHSCRWDYNITGGDPTGNPMSKLANKRVGVIGTGASGLQLIPELAKDAGKLYVFQRTPASITLRDQTPPDPAVIASWPPGWQRQQMDDFDRIFNGVDVSDTKNTAIEGIEAHTVRAVYKEAMEAGVEFKPEKIMEWLKLADFRHMDKMRKMIEEVVEDKDTAEKLKPWYSFACKRPNFHTTYFQTFNKSNVELVDTDGRGIDYLTETAVVANGKEYEVDLLIYSSGYEFQIGANIHRATGINLVGSKGETLDEKWQRQEKGPSTLFGIHIRDFPNLFYIGPTQTGVSGNQLHNIYTGAEHIAPTIAKWLQDPGFLSAEPSEEGEEEWGQEIEAGAKIRLDGLKLCTPGLFNFQGKPEEIPARCWVYPWGVVAWAQAMKEWRDQGFVKDMEVKRRKSFEQDELST